MDRMQQVLTYKYGVLIKLGWQRLAHVELSSTANEINSGTFTAKESLLVQLHGVASGSISGSDLQFNGDTGSNYARRYSANSDSDGTGTSESTLGGIGTASGDSFVTWHITNIADKEKLVIGEGMSNTTGNNAPDRREIVGKWANTSAQITSIKVKENGSGGWASGTTLTVWGDASETVTDEKTTLSDIPANTRYEEIDTRKIYRWKQAPLSPSFHYKFSESSGDVVNHGSVASADLTVNSLTRDQSTPSGIGNGMKTPNEDSGYAENTSRINDYKFMHDGTSKWSVSFWLKCYDVPQNASGYSTEHSIFGNCWTDDAGIGFAIRLAMNQSPTSTSKARIQTFIADGDAGMPLNDQTANDMMPDITDWHFYCVTYDPTLSSNNLTVTRDASTSGTGFHQGDYDDVAYSTSNPTRKTTYMARPTTGGNAYDNGVMGTMAQIIIWKGHILTQAEKVSLYASGNGTTTLPSPLEWKERNTA